MWAMPAESGTQAIDRAANLLVSVVESGRPLGIGELSESAGLPKSTTSRLVGALERRGLVQRGGDRRVAPGPVLLRFAHRDSGESIVDLAAPALKALAALSGETINLGVPTPLGVEHLAQEDSRHFVGGTNWVGRRVPYETTANGKVLKAYATRSREGAAVRERGYATAVDELEHGLAALAAPIFGPDGDAVAALSISGPTIRLTRDRIAELAPALLEQARLVSMRLGNHDQRGAA
jgi:DNA-binding IclR family transcriptional regulator